MSLYQQFLADAIAVFHSLGEFEPGIRRAAELCTSAILSGNKLLLCGNGGSAAEAQHLAGELAGRFLVDRRALPAVALNVDGAVLTCIGNDYRFEDVFARQVEALGKQGDVLIVFTTSGNSPNVVRALERAADLGLRTIAFLGCDGGRAKAKAELPLLVASTHTARIQEAHQFLMHCLVALIEGAIVSPSQPC